MVLVPLWVVLSCQAALGLGTAVMAAGDRVTLNFNGDSLVDVTIDRGTPETRRSLLHIEIDKRRDRPAMLRVGGDTVLVTQGTLTLDS